MTKKNQCLVKVRWLPWDPFGGISQQAFMALRQWHSNKAMFPECSAPQISYNRTAIASEEGPATLLYLRGYRSLRAFSLIIKSRAQQKAKSLEKMTKKTEFFFFSISVVSVLAVKL